MAVALALVLAGCAQLGAGSEDGPPLPPSKARNGFLSSGGPLIPEQAAFDVLHYELALEVDPASRTIAGSLVMKARAVAPLDHVVLDLDDALVVRLCASGGAAARFRRSYGMVSIALGRSRAAGEEFVVTVAYDGAPRVAPNAPWDGGFTWGTTQDGRPWIATSCQTDGADLWWPCKDHPSDKADRIDLRVTVPAELVVAANGKLVADATGEDGTKRTFHWRLDTPISNYCLALNIAPYELIAQEYESVTGEKVPVRFYVVPEHLEQGQAALPHFLRDLRIFEQLCGPFPFRAEKYGVAETPHLGMEHATITAYGNRFRADADGYDWLHNHELAHDWWANLVTCRDWNDTWIHEGIGSYMQPLTLEKIRGREALIAEVKKQRRGLRNAKPVAPRETMTAREAYQSDVYGKGSCVMHSLRWLLGDEKFFVVLRRMAYPDPALERVTDGSQIRFADTEDLRAIAEEHGGVELGWFFEVYLRRAPLPELVVERSGDTLELSWKAPDALPFPMPVPIVVDGATRRVELPEGRARLPIPAAAKVEIDPEGWVLKK